MATYNPADLPTELLLKIFEHLEPQDILNVGILCRRLALISTPIYLARKGLPDPETFCRISPSSKGHSDEVTALTLNYSLVSMKQFTCIFTGESESRRLSRISDLTWNIRRVNKLLSRLASIGIVTLAFYPKESHSLRSNYMRDFMPAFFELLNTIFQKSCTSLQVLESHSLRLDEIYRFEFPETNTAAVWQGVRHFFAKYISFKSSEDRFLQGSGWRYRELSTGNPVPLSKPPILLQSRLTHVDLCSNFLLLPPFAPYIFGLLKCSPISSLTLSLLRSTPAVEFRHFIFPRIIDTVPRLEEIKFAHFYRDSLSVVVRNLSAFPRLRRVTFGPRFPHDSTLLPIIWPSRRHLLTHLKSFTGSLDQAVYLFTQPISCPNLKAINITYHLTRSRDPPFHDEPDQKALLTKISSLGNRLSEMNLKPVITMCHLSEGSFSGPPFLEDEFESLKELNGVTRLNIETPWFYHENDILASQISIALSFLRLFPRVKSFSLISHYLPPDPRKAEEHRSAILAAILMEHPGIVSSDIIYNPLKHRHNHWRNALDNLDRTKPSEPCICSDF
ncbi:hypothetical protein GALMADRAFT_263405 [Galerina marginata CBS 339.88]|uniref:F-box domain-containing protein n=1 Tax=Galerina marginata (strain CBS 339.88) TaxID=685588 RepID=A0A067TKX2_GALM3|nr:hypothetical protein GALMADRAFT_263405 [Galerina marginata CBS 339.88]